MYLLFVATIVSWTKMEMVLIYRSFSAVLGSEKFVPEIKEKFIRESGEPKDFHKDKRG